MGSVVKALLQSAGYRYKLYREYLPVYRRIRKKKMPIGGRGYGFMTCMTQLLIVLGMLALMLLSRIAGVN